MGIFPAIRHNLHGNWLRSAKYVVYRANEPVCGAQSRVGHVAVSRLCMRTPSRIVPRKSTAPDESTAVLRVE